MKRKQVIAIAVISVLLVIALVLLALVLSSDMSDSDSSTGNVIGDENAVLLEVRPMALRTFGKSESLTLSWWTGYDGEDSFVAENMLPGDSITKEYTVTVKNRDALTLIFDVTVTETSLLEDILEMTVEVEGDVVFDGLLRDAKDIRVPLESNSSKQELTYKITVSLPASAGNEYQRLSLTASFAWSLDEKPYTPTPQPEITTAYVPETTTVPEVTTVTEVTTVPPETTTEPYVTTTEPYVETTTGPDVVTTEPYTETTTEPIVVPPTPGEECDFCFCPWCALLHLLRVETDLGCLCPWCWIIPLITLIALITLIVIIVVLRLRKREEEEEEKQIENITNIIE